MKATFIIFQWRGAPTTGASAPLTGDEVGPSDRKLNFVQKAAAPYLVYNSPRERLSCRTMLLLSLPMQVGNAEASNGRNVSAIQWKRILGSNGNY